MGTKRTHHVSIKIHISCMSCFRNSRSQIHHKQLTTVSRKLCQSAYSSHNNQLNKKSELMLKRRATASV